MLSKNSVVSLNDGKILLCLSDFWLMYTVIILGNVYYVQVG